MTDTATIQIKGTVADNFENVKAELIRRTPWAPGEPSKADVLYFALDQFAEGLIIAEQEQGETTE